MNKFAELFGHSAAKLDVDWKKTVAEQQYVYLNKKCYKVRKSEPGTSIGSCTVLCGRDAEPIIICPTRLIGCSSATTLIMNGLEFGGQELSKRPDMIGQSSGHAGALVAPLGLDQS